MQTITATMHWLDKRYTNEPINLSVMADDTEIAVKLGARFLDLIREDVVLKRRIPSKCGPVFMLLTACLTSVFR